MKIAVLADIHGNLPALQTVSKHIEKWCPDHVIVAGDTVNRGPRSIECLDFVWEKKATDHWQVVRGNHEDYVIARSLPGDPRHGPQFDLYRSSFYTYNQLNRDVSRLTQMLEELNLDFMDAGELRVTHASMKSRRHGIYPMMDDEDISRVIAPPPSVICVGHTHRPLVKQVENTLVVNAGAVGLPFDGDRRASYAQLVYENNQWKASIIRIPYDYDQAENDFTESGFLEKGGPLARLMLVELQLAYSQLWQWTQLYQDKVLNGEISIQKAADDFLVHPNTAWF